MISRLPARGNRDAGRNDVYRTLNHQQQGQHYDLHNASRSARVE